MRLLGEDREIVRRLDDLIVIVVISRQHRWARLRSGQTADIKRLVFGRIGRVFVEPGARLVESFLPLRRHGWKSSIGWIDDSGSAAIPAYFSAPVIPFLVIGAAEVRFGAAIAPFTVHFLAAFLRIRGNFFLAVELLIPEFHGAFERREAGAVPDAFKIRMPVRSAGRCPFCGGRFALGWHGRRDRLRSRGVQQTGASQAASARKPMWIMCRWIIQTAPSLTRLFAKIPVQQFFGEFRTLEFH